MDNWKLTQLLDAYGVAAVDDARVGESEEFRANAKTVEREARRRLQKFCLHQRGETNLRCPVCGKDTQDDYMTTKECWQEANLHYFDNVHLACLPLRLGRPLTPADFIDAPINDEILACLDDPTVKFTKVELAKVIAELTDGLHEHDIQDATALPLDRCREIIAMGSLFTEVFWEKPNA